MNVKKILVVDDHPLLREGVVATLNASAGMEVVAEGENGEDALILARTLKPDAVLLDLNMPGGGIEAVRNIHEQFPEMKIIVLTASETEEDVMLSLKMGASGYILKGVSGAELTRIIEDVCRGASYITPHLATNLLVGASSPGRSNDTGKQAPKIVLHKREREILIALQEGMSNKQIADKLCLSEKTIKHYMTRILQKLQVRNRVEAALFAQKNNII